MSPRISFAAVPYLAALSLFLPCGCAAPAERPRAGVQAAEDADSPSPLLAAGTAEGIWLPGTYGGVTGVVLDLARVGTDHMLRVRFKNAGDLRPLAGRAYRLHSDTTTRDEKRDTTERRVVLVDDESLRQWGRKQVICYKIFSYTDRVDDRGRKLTSEATHYYLTMSEISDDYDVLYLVNFWASFPNHEHPNLTKAPKN